MNNLNIGLLGSGEFEAWSEPVDRSLLARARRGRILVLPTASAPEGDDVFNDWGERGLAHYRRLGIEAEVLPLKTRTDADSEAFSAKILDAAVIFFSGGNPAYLVETLIGTRFWTSLGVALAEGAAYAGCSAGAVAIGDLALDSSHEEMSPSVWRPGLSLMPGVCIGPHWDALDSYIPGLQDFFIRSVPATATLLTIDESTAVVADGETWSVVGSGRAQVRRDGAWLEFPAGTSFSRSVLSPPLLA
jgi:cyanophycinase